MSVIAAEAGFSPRGIPARRFAEWGLGGLVFLGAFVLFEPAPYELALVGLIVLWVVTGLKLNRYILPLFVLLVLYIVGALIGLTLKEGWSDPIIYVGTSALLAASAVFYAAVVSADPERRFGVILHAYVAAALVSSAIGILGYFDLLPASDLFTLYDRARGTFQDPNVFGPFLILPFTYLAYSIFTRPLRQAFWPAVAAGVIVLALFLSFSRAAWGMTLLAAMLAATLAYINQRNVTARARIMLYLAIGFVLGVAMIAVALSLPGTSDLFSQRAQLVQDYDAGALGRFERHILGFQLALEHPLGIGPFSFGKIFGEDEHNMWLKGFMVYGWLGGFAYIALAVWTLIISTPLIFKKRPWQPLIIAAWVTFIGHLIIHNVIDNDHWRHLFLVYGVLWGAYSVERLRRHREARARSAPVVFHAALPRSGRLVGQT